MPERDVILAKVSTIQRCLRRIKEVTGLNPESLDDINIQDIFILNLQRAVEASIDIATHIVASEGLGLSTTIKDNFKFLNREVYLYGSFAKGEIHEGSDIDLLIIGDFRERFFERIGKVLDLTDLPIEPPVYTIEEFEGLKNSRNTFITEVIKTAIKL